MTTAMASWLRLFMVAIGLWALLAHGQQQRERRLPRERKRPESRAKTRPIRKITVVNDAPREPFTLKKADDELGWVDPTDHEEEDKVFGQYLETAYRRAAIENGYEERHMRIKNLPSFFMHLMDIDRRGLDHDEQRVIMDKVAELQKKEGLVDPDQTLYHGYLCAGKVRDFMRRTFDELKEARQLKNMGGGWQVRREALAEGL